MHATIFALLAAVNVTRDVAYAADVVDGKHRLDVYSPAGVRAAPVLVFIHGGGFVQGDRRDYNGLATAIASTGIVVVVPSYRLFPQADARGAATDVAAAVAWTVKHVSAFGGNPRGVVLSGHSAGAYLAALVGLAPTFLSAYGVPPRAIRGIAGFSGIYDVGDIDPAATPSDRELLQHYFGETQEARSTLSPITYAAKTAPPMALYCGGVYDAVACGQRDLMFAALVHAGADVQMDADASATHSDVVANLARSGTPEQRALLEFIEKYAR
ncbi:MAG: alpha/beta hydrolase [Candidatus Eremiobacteraeota bacterium]|nr:alpha/beta hydrolase [Candidatus Eremiobacteraeota bacterium]